MRDDEIEIHPKVWGEEHWIVNERYCGKKLVLRQGYRCSAARSAMRCGRCGGSTGGEAPAAERKTGAREGARLVV